MDRTTALEKDRQFIWHPFTQMQTAEEPLHVVEAFGATLLDSNGKTYIDANSSWWVNVHGHGNEHIGLAISNQFKQLDHIIFAGATHPQAIRLAERVVNLLPDSLTKVFFSDNGSTAVEVALKMAFQFWHNHNSPKHRIVAMDGAYHGDTFGAMSIGQRGYFNQPFEHFFFDVDFIDFPTVETENYVLKQAECLFQTGEIAAFIVEPIVQGSAGMRFYSVELLNQLVELAKLHNVLVIFDEVMTAWGRLGRLFALDQCTVVPDIVCLSKGLTGGTLPLGLTVASEKIYAAFLHPEKVKALLHGHSFTGNALSCAAANASLDLFEDPKTWESISRIELQHLEFLEILHQEPNIKDAQVFGTILRFEIQTGEGNTYFSEIRDQAYRFFLDHGCLIRPLGNIIYINPPYCISTEELAKIHSTLIHFIQTYRQGIEKIVN